MGMWDQELWRSRHCQVISNFRLCRINAPGKQTKIFNWYSSSGYSRSRQLSLAIMVYASWTMDRLLSTVICFGLAGKTYCCSLHTMNKRATPMNIMKYKHSIELYRLYNGHGERDDWMDLNFQQNFNRRNDCVNVIDNSRLRVGKNLLVNRLTIINDLVKYDWMNCSLDTFKVKCKNLFLKWDACKNGSSINLNDHDKIYFLNVNMTFTMK